MIRVLLADDQALVRAGFRMLLESAEDITIVGEAPNGGAAVALARELRPDVVLMDLSMPEVDGLTATRRITADPQLAAVRVVVLTTFDDDEHVFGALRASERIPGQGRGTRGTAAGGPGGGPRRCAPGPQRDPVPHRRLHDRERGAGQCGPRQCGAGAAGPGTGQRRAGPGSQPRPGEPAPARRPGPGVASLTEREREVVALVAAGLSNDEIAAELVVSPLTAKTHVSRAMIKLGARDRAQAVVLAYENGLAEPGPADRSLRPMLTERLTTRRPAFQNGRKAGQIGTGGQSRPFVGTRERPCGSALTAEIRLAGRHGTARDAHPR